MCHLAPFCSLLENALLVLISAFTFVQQSSFPTSLFFFALRESVQEDAAEIFPEENRHPLFFKPL